MYLGKDIDASLVKALRVGYQQNIAQVLAEGKSSILRNLAAVERQAQYSFSRLNTLDVAKRSRARLPILANTLSKPIDVFAGGDRCAAFGAARLAMLAESGESTAMICTTPEILESFVPNVEQTDHYRKMWERYGKADPALKEPLAI